MSASVAKQRVDVVEDRPEAAAPQVAAPARPPGAGAGGGS